MNDFNVYLASAYSSKRLVDQFARSLCNDVPTVKIISRWHTLPGMVDLAERAHTDYSDIDRAHLLIALYPYGYGTVSEMGYALAKRIPIVYYRDADHGFDDPLPVGMLKQLSTGVCIGCVATTYEEVVTATATYSKTDYDTIYSISSDLLA